MSNVNGLSVVSSARKLIALVPNTNRVVSFPEGAVLSQYGKGNENPVIIVQNGTDPTLPWQGAHGGVGHYIIVNEVGEDAAIAFLNHLGGTDYSVETLEAALAELAEAGFRDQYTTDVNFVNSKLATAGQVFTSEDGGVIAGVVARSDRDLCKVYRDAEGVLQIVVGNNEPRRIEDDILLRTYRTADGGLISLDDVPSEEIEA